MKQIRSPLSILNLAVTVPLRNLATYARHALISCEDFAKHIVERLSQRDALLLRASGKLIDSSQFSNQKNLKLNASDPRERDSQREC